MPITFHDDEMADAFILENFGNEIHGMYKSFPVGAMRSDFWRYAVIYMHGGIYGDIDTLCKRPVQQWLPAEKPPEWENYEPGKWYSVGGMAFTNLTWSDCSMIIAREPSGWFCQWVRIVSIL